MKRNNGPLEQEIKRLKRSLEEKAAPLREQLLQEKREKIPAALRADVKAAAKVAEDSRNELQKYLVAAFEEFLTVEPNELEKRFEAYRKESAKVNEAVMEAEKKLQPRPSIRALFDMPGQPTPAYLLLRGSTPAPAMGLIPESPRRSGRRPGPIASGSLPGAAGAAWLWPGGWDNPITP